MEDFWESLVCVCVCVGRIGVTFSTHYKVVMRYDCGKGIAWAIRPCFPRRREQ